MFFKRGANFLAVGVHLTGIRNPGRRSPQTPLEVAMKIDSKLGRTIGKASIGIAAAAAAATTLGACTVPGMVAGAGKTVAAGGSHQLQPFQYHAPTANLTKLANAIVEKNKSVTIQVSAPLISD